MVRARSALSSAEVDEVAPVAGSEGVGAEDAPSSVHCSRSRSGWVDRLRQSAVRSWVVAGEPGYRAVDAERAAWSRARRPKPTKLSRLPGLAAMVEG